jgi:hypothetical protein
VEIIVLKIIRCLNEGENINNYDLREKEVKNWVAASTNAYANIGQQVGNYRLKQIHTKK